MREERHYTHRRCNTQTVISGPEFQAMSDPLAGMETTYCVNCDDQFPVTEFTWSDTNELISDYYARYRQKATSFDIWCCGNGGLAALAVGGLLGGVILGTSIGLMTSWTVGIIAAIVLALVGAVGGVVIRESVVSRRIVRRVCGVADTRSLR